MANTRGVFKLRRINEEKIPLDEWVDLSGVWHYPSGQATPNTGYFGGGHPGPNSSVVDKITYSNDTTARVPGANLPQALGRIAAVGSSTAAYFGGGNPGNVVNVQKTTYATDTTARIPGADLSVGRSVLAATGNSDAGYFGGGTKTFAPTNVATIDKLTYASDTTGALPGTADLSLGRSGLAATGNADAGYFGGGSPSQSRMDKITYSNDTTVYTPGANLSVARAYVSATGNSTHGYFGGGLANPGIVATVDKTTYASDTTAAVPGAVLSVARAYMGATGNLSAGYFGGGYTGSSYISTMDKTTYSSDTTAAVPGAALSVIRYYLAGASARANGLSSTGPAPSSPAVRFTDGAAATPNAGYFAGGNPGGPTSKIDKLDFSTETTANLPGANLSVGRKYMGAAGGTTQGYFAGGHQPPVHSRTDKLTYSTDTAAYTPSANLHTSRRDVAGTGNLVAGYFVGGQQSPGPGAGQSYVDKTTYSNDSTGRIPGCNIGQPYPSDVTANTAKQKAGCGNLDISFFNGGPGERSFADKITYASDTAATTPSAFLVIGRVGHGAAGNGDAGYFAGGLSNNPAFESRVEKTTYSNDTTTAVPSANLNSDNWYIAGTSNATAAYFGSGLRAYEMNKMTFATETTALSPGAKQSESRYAYGAVSSRMNGFPGQDPPAATPTPTTVPVPAPTPNTGYIGGGKNPSPTSSTEKISYASETTGRIPGADLSVARVYLGAIGTPSVGYFCGGDGGGSVVDKTTYASDTTARVPGANLTIAGTNTAVMGNTTQGYLNQGDYPSHSNMMKVTYSTETTATLPSTADLSVPARTNVSISNTDHGYTAGGRDQPGPSITHLTNVDKTVFSTDTTSRIPGANLAFARGSGATTGDSTTGYFGAGQVQGQPTTDTSTVEKITYSSDTRANVPSSANLSAGGRDLAATGNTTAGYFMGGKVIPGFALTSKVDRLTYATETRATVPGAKLDAARGEGGQNATGARANGRSDTTAVAVPVII